MINDWNFWLSCVTAVFALIAICISIRQTRLSNKQALFERRLRLYLLTKEIDEVCVKNKSIFAVYNKLETTNDMCFLNMTNTACIEDVAVVIKHVADNKYHEQFLRKRDELKKSASECRFVFKKRVGTALCDFIESYESVLAGMYTYQMVLDKIDSDNKKKPMEIDVLAKRHNEGNYRELVYDSLQRLKKSHQLYLEIEDKLKKQIVLR